MNYSWFEDNLQVRVDNLNISLNMSTVTGLLDFIEDEVVPKPLPMQVLMQIFILI